MKQLAISFFLLLALSSVACRDVAKEMFETAKFEELQNNKEHAHKLYRRIIKQYPDSQFARKAQDQIRELKFKMNQELKD